MITFKDARIRNNEWATKSHKWVALDGVTIGRVKASQDSSKTGSTWSATFGYTSDLAGIFTTRKAAVEALVARHNG